MSLETQPSKPRRFCRGILPQFADKILSGEKTTTIRPDAKDMQAGDLISFWVGWRKKEPRLYLYSRCSRCTYDNA